MAKLSLTFAHILNEKKTTFLILGFTRTEVLRAGSAKTNGSLGWQNERAEINTWWEHSDGANQRQTKKPPNGRYILL
ncbi:unnamed protein product [Clavelina lepadiformis]|uniref:Uncharacterized protein n=1 Tax=Clavelina lepadiformis TaxID=159417 RepID=A0ABP0FU21_CLALP